MNQFLNVSNNDKRRAISIKAEVKSSNWYVLITFSRKFLPLNKAFDKQF